MVYSHISIDTRDVIAHMAHIFNGHPSLIQGFNVFVPVGYEIESNSVTTPTGTMMQITDNEPGSARFRGYTTQDFETPDAPADESESSSAVGM
jgi:paired amphipathic helix protein Sin3a